MNDEFVLMMVTDKQIVMGHYRSYNLRTPNRILIPISTQSQFRDDLRSLYFPSLCLLSFVNEMYPSIYAVKDILINTYCHVGERTYPTNENALVPYHLLGTECLVNVSFSATKFGIFIITSDYETQKCKQFIVIYYRKFTLTKFST